jgi:predicted porin
VSAAFAEWLQLLNREVSRAGESWYQLQLEEKFMQKKLIALAVAGMVAAPLAMAQSNVTIYGLVDMGLTHYSDSASKAANRTGLDQGLLNGSRIGFRGTEDLGNGLKAGFVLEGGLAPDTGSGLSMNRQSFLTLSGDFGTVAVGRQYTPQFNLWGAADPFGLGAAGNAANIAQVQTRLSNLIAYVSPNFNGLSVTAGYTFNGVNVFGEDEFNNDNGVRVWAISPVYKNGPLMVGLNYHVATVKVDGSPVDGDKAQKRLDLAGTYDFGPVMAHAAYGRDRADQSIVDVGLASRANYWMVGVSAPVGAAGKVMASYNNWKDKGAGSSAKASQWALGYEHKLSARTKMYAVYADVNNKNGATASVTSAGTGDYQKGLQVAIQHRF